MIKRLSLCVASLVCAMSAQTTYAHEIGMKFNEVVHTSDAAFVGRVSSITSVPHPSGFISTKIVFDEVSEVLSRPSSRAQLGQTVTIEMGGGTAGKVSLSMCCSPEFKIGEEYLILSQLDGGKYLNPFSGGRQGIFRIAYDDRGTAYPLTYGFQGIEKVGDKKLHLTSQVISLRDGVPEYNIVSRNLNTQSPVEVNGNGASKTRLDSTPRQLVTLNELVESIGQIAQRKTPTDVEKRSGQRPAFQAPRRIGQRMTEKPVFDQTERLERGTICFCGDVDDAITMEQVPTAWTAWGQNNNLMYRFNQHTDIFTYTASDGTWANNWDDEFCGWPTSGQIANQYQSGWSWGASVIAVCWTSDFCSCCEIREADIMHNPAFSWRYDLDDVIGTSNILYRPTTRHELGHAVGLERRACGAETYSYNQPCSMTAHWSGSVVEDGRGMHALDVLALRNLYIDEAIEDVGVESYYASGGLISSTLSDTNLEPGDTFNIENVTVENVSTNSQSGIRVRVYLSENKYISEYDYELADFSFSNFSAATFWTGDLTSIKIPDSSSTSIPGGTYYVGLIATLDGTSYWWDDCSVNNSTYIPTQITVGDYVPSWTPGIAIPLDFTWLYYALHINNSNSEDNSGQACGGEFTGGIWYRFFAKHSGRLNLAMKNDQEEGGGTGNNEGDRFAGSSCNDAIEVYAGFPDTGSQPIAQGCRTCEAPVVASIQKGQEYYVRIGGIDGAEINGVLSFDLEPFDLIGDKPDLAIPAGHEPIVGDMNGFSSSTGAVCTQTDVIDVWYRYTAPASGDIRASTCSPATRIDTTLAIYDRDGNQVLACNDDDECGISESQQSSTVVWSAEAGQEFLVRVGGPDLMRGTFGLSIEAAPNTPSNTACGGAISASTNNRMPFSTWGAPSPGQVFECDNNRIGCGVWVKWGASETGTVAIGTSEDIGGSATFDAALAIFDSCEENMKPVACSMDASNTGQPIALLNVEAGDVYFIYVGSDVDAGCLEGNGMLSMEYQEQELCVGDATGDRTVDLDDFSELLIQFGSTGESSADFNGDLVVDLEDFSLLLVNYGNTCS